MLKWDVLKMERIFRRGGSVKNISLGSVNLLIRKYNRELV